MHDNVVVARAVSVGMVLSAYTGRSPVDDDRTIGRVSRHHRWTVDGDLRDRCGHCGGELTPAERHLLVTLRASAPLDDARRYLCDETCLREWVGE